jgi:mRNA interferase HicA
VKRGQLIRELAEHGCVLKRHGKKHDLYFNARTGKSTPIPRHSEIKNTLATVIKRQLGIEKD